MHTVVMILFSFMVLLMFPGIALFYAGMVRSHNALNTTFKCYICLFVISLQWVFVGFSISFGAVNGFDSFSGFFNGLMQYVGLENVTYANDSNYGSDIPFNLFMFFQMLFACLATSIIAGSIVERMKTIAFIIFIVIWTTLIYDPLAHIFWASDGLFATSYRVLDFAGGNVVHISAGVAGLVLALAVGGRLYRKSKPHHIPQTILGGVLLYLGWFGFNCGSNLSLNRITMLVLINTHVSACIGAIAWISCEYIKGKKFSILGAISGAISGLVAITPGCAYVTLSSSLLIGGIGAVVCYFGTSYIKEKLKYDDSLDAFGLHGIGGIWGGIATGIFASTKVNSDGLDGLLYGKTTLFIHHVVAVTGTVLFVAVGSYAIIIVIKQFMRIRVDRRDEKVGLDISFHEEEAYGNEKMRSKSV